MPSQKLRPVHKSAPGLICLLDVYTGEKIMQVRAFERYIPLITMMANDV